MMQIMGAFSTYMEVPEEHLAEHSALPAFEQASRRRGRRWCGFAAAKEKPASSYAVVNYAATVLDRGRRLGDEACADGGHVLLHAPGNRG